MPDLDDLTHVLLTLQAERTRATYGAVGGHLGVTPRFLMNGRPRDPLHSWIVGKESSRPTGYSEALWHEDLLSTERILQTPEEVRALLEAHHGPAASLAIRNRRARRSHRSPGPDP